MTDFQIAGLITATVLLIVLLPIALRRNRGRLLPYAAVWLAAITLVTFLYQTFGPPG